MATARGKEVWGKWKRAKQGSKVAEGDLTLGGEHTGQGVIELCTCVVLLTSVSKKFS